MRNDITAQTVQYLAALLETLGQQHRTLTRSPQPQRQNSDNCHNNANEGLRRNQCRLAVKTRNVLCQGRDTGNRTFIGDVFTIARACKQDLHTVQDYCQLTARANNTNNCARSVLVICSIYQHDDESNRMDVNDALQRQISVQDQDIITSVKIREEEYQSRTDMNLHHQLNILVCPRGKRQHAMMQIFCEGGSVVPYGTVPQLDWLSSLYSHVVDIIHLTSISGSYLLGYTHPA